LYGYETWAVTLRVKRLKVFENRIVREIFGSKMDEIVGEWRKLHKEELRNMYSRSITWAGHVTRMGERRNACRILLGKPEVKRLVRRPRCK
jgi:hypothetical protein